MRTPSRIFALIALAFLVACPGGGTVSRMDASDRGDGAQEADLGAVPEETSGEILWDHPVADDFGASDPGEVGDIPMDIWDATVEVPRVECSSDEECRDILGGPRTGECLRVFCDLSVGECRAEAAPDGTPCTLQTLCEEDGMCLQGACKGNPIVCDDDNPCTDDSCDAGVGCVFTNNTAPCDDGNECTMDDACHEGRCVGTPACGCQTDADCLPYEDGDLCNGTLRCQDATCVVDPASVIHCEPPEGKPCLMSQCVPATGACVTVPRPEGFPCNDEDSCTLQERCTNGECVGQPAICDDHDPCTQDLCDSAKGCLFVPANNGAPCSDGNACTVNDVCWGGTCAGTAMVCNDGNPCTDDACDPVTGECVFTNNTDPCDDGNACTVNDTCADGQCSGTPRVCDDINSCTADSCDPGIGCVYVPANDGQKCSDGNACTTNDVCAGGKCAGTPKVCNDGNPCTDDACDPVTGECVFTNNAAPCDDGNACTVNDTCADGQCSGTPRVCDDINSCTADSCDPGIGCVFVPANDGKKCSDGNLCTTNDVCAGGKCAGTPKVCDDGNPCTTDSCDKKTGACVFTNNTDPCDDGNACTVNDTCADGQCSGTPRVCDDINSCTADSCDPAVGCVFVPANDGKKCSDGNACTTNDVCAGGKCAGTPKVCDDGNPCTTDSCDKKTGACVFTNNTDPCDDGNACTTGDACQGGQCSGSPVTCNDHNECTTDSCNPAVGCVFQTVPNWPPTPCDGQWHFCFNGQCVGLPGGP